MTRLAVSADASRVGPEAQDAAAVAHPGRAVELVPAGLEELVGEIDAHDQPDDRRLRILEQELRDRRILDQDGALRIGDVLDCEHHDLPRVRALASRPLPFSASDSKVTVGAEPTLKIRGGGDSCAVADAPSWAGHTSRRLSGRPGPSRPSGAQYHGIVRERHGGLTVRDLRILLVDDRREVVRLGLQGAAEPASSLRGDRRGWRR